MTKPGKSPIELIVAAGAFSFLLSLYGLAALRGLDIHLDTALSIAYGALPLMSLPLYLLALFVRRLLPIQTMLVLAYVPVYSAMNWRTCAELDYCGTIASVVVMTIMTSKVLLFCGVALASLAAFVTQRADGRSARRRQPESRTSS